MGRVICAGHVNWDVTLCVDRLPATDGEATITDRYQGGGGSASNVATVLAGLGVAPTLLGSVGTDERGRRVRRNLTAAGVDCAPLVTADGATTVKYLVVDGDGDVMVLGSDGVNEAYSAADLDDATLADADHLHLTNQDPATAAALARRATDRGLTVSLDPGRRIDRRDFSTVIGLADTVFVNQREASTAIRDYFGPVDDLGCTVVLKRGCDGAEVLTADGRYANHEGSQLDAVDTTGAGDAFAAGFVATRLTSATPDYERCLAVANACGALACRERGARTRIASDDVDRLLEPA